MSTTAILRHLSTNRAATAFDLGKALRLSPGAVRAGLAQLESQRLVRGSLAKGETDRRFLLTDEGRRRTTQQAESSKAIRRMVEISQELGLE